MTKYLIALALLLGATVAHAQSTPEFPPTGSTYTLRFVAYSGTAEVCVFPVTQAGSVLTGIDRTAPTGFDKADAYGCKTAVVADGTTVNTLVITLTPAPSDDVLVAAVSYPAAGSTRPVSNFSGPGTLLVRLKPIDWR